MPLKIGFMASILLSESYQSNQDRWWIPNLGKSEPLNSIKYINYLMEDCSAHLMYLWKHKLVFIVNDHSFPFVFLISS